MKRIQDSAGAMTGWARIPAAALLLAVFPATAAAQCLMLEERSTASPNVEDGAWFGRSVAVDEGTQLAVVGAPYEDGGGAVYVYKINYGNWDLHQRLTASDQTDRDQFGGSLSLDGFKLVVGAPASGPTFEEAGAVYVFTYHPLVAQFVETQKLVSSMPEDYAEFGETVSLQDDLLVVGEPEGGYLKSGAAYVFRDNAGTWSLEQRLQGSVPDWNAYFGTWVSLDGDVILIGTAGTGAAYAFRYSYDTFRWLEEQRILYPDTDPDHYFGSKVCVAGDVAAIGATKADGAVPDCGAVYLFRHDPGLRQWLFEEKLLAPDGATDDQFGCAIALSGGVMVVGAKEADLPWPAGSDAGAAYLYRDSGSGWVEYHKLVLRRHDYEDRHGYAVALDGDALVVSAPNADYPSLEDVGQAALYNAAEFFLEVSPIASEGQPLTLAACCAPPGDRVMISVVEVDGLPWFQPILLWVFSGNCDVSATGIVPPGLAGVEMTFQAFKFAVTGEVIGSNLAPVLFQS